MSLLTLTVSCKNRKQYSSSLINNPITASGNDDMSVLPTMTFESTTHDFGDLITGESIRYSFKFTNEGKSDLIISSAKAGCGCTVPNFPKHPIKPGESGFIDVTFDSKGIIGFQNKSIQVQANTQPNVTTLYIKANVKRGQ